MKFAIWILIITAGLSLLALLVNEFLPPQVSTVGWYRKIGIVDPFRAWWFRALLGLLSLSLLVCVVERAPKQFRLAFQRLFRTRPSQFADAKNYIKTTSLDGIALGEKFLKELGLSFHRRDGEGWTALSGMSGGLSRLGPLALHIGMLALIVGALIASLTHYSARVSGSAGREIELPEWGFKVRVDTFFLDYYPAGVNMWVETAEGLRAKVRAVYGDSADVNIMGHQNKEIVQRYAISDLRADFLVSERGKPAPYQGNVRSYISDVTVIDDGREVRRQRIEVNHPLRHNGYRFYQSSFETAEAHRHIDSLIIHCASDEFGQARVTAPVSGPSQPLPWGGFSISVVQFYPDFRLDEQMRPFSISGDLNNPVARIKLLLNDDELGSAWAFSGMMGHSGSGGLPVSFILADVAGVETIGGGYTTIFDVNREQGREFIWLGITLATLGLLIAYIFDHRLAWVLAILKSNGTYELHLAGGSRREGNYFHQKFKDAAAKLGIVSDVVF
ncbi:MAG: cytochrome c biogenesis protein ResB [Calditrichaeota bacterium]|nr:cytochrome c biogenesis protein ResB [Calditrichota bacterium]